MQIAGDYTLTYSVADSVGNITEKTRKITVLNPVIEDDTPEDDSDKPSGYVTVQFLPGENGSLEGTRVYYVHPNAIVSLTAPEVTANEGYKHTGWNHALTSTFTRETQITAEYDDVVDEQDNIIPYIPENDTNPIDKNDPEIPKVDDDGTSINIDDYYILGFYTDGHGLVDGELAKSFLVRKGTTFDSSLIPKATPKEGYRFLRWSSQLPSDGKLVENVSIQAIFELIEDDKPPTDADKYTPVVTPITKDIGQPTTGDEILDAITIPNYPEDLDPPKFVISIYRKFQMEVFLGLIQLK